MSRFIRSVEWSSLETCTIVKASVCVCCPGLYCPCVETPDDGPNLSSLPEGEFIYLRSDQKVFKKVPRGFAGGSPLHTCLLSGTFRCLHSIKAFQLFVILAVAANK